MKRRDFLIGLVALLAGVYTLQAQVSVTAIPRIKDSFNVLLGTDLGRNGHYSQQPIAELMGKTAETVDFEFIIASGDTHHYMGVQSVNDPLWMTNYEWIYSHPELQIEWYPVLGNHEYRGNTQAVIDYSEVSRRWCMPDRYYTQSYELKNGESIRFIYVDTPPLIDGYRKNAASYPDAGKQDLQQQLDWIESTLAQAPEKWKVVVGHHPIYAETSKKESERLDLQNRLDPILRKYEVDMYICGHIHNFQHIRQAGNTIDYIVNSSGSLSRKVAPVEGTQFCDPSAGFSILSLLPGELNLHMINDKGEVIHTVSRKK